MIATYWVAQGKLILKPYMVVLKIMGPFWVRDFSTAPNIFGHRNLEELPTWFLEIRVPFFGGSGLQGSVRELKT